MSPFAWLILWEIHLCHTHHHRINMPLPTAFGHTWKKYIYWPANRLFIQRIGKKKKTKHILAIISLWIKTFHKEFRKMFWNIRDWRIFQKKYFTGQHLYINPQSLLWFLLINLYPGFRSAHRLWPIKQVNQVPAAVGVAVQFLCQCWSLELQPGQIQHPAAAGGGLQGVASYHCQYLHTAYGSVSKNISRCFGLRQTTPPPRFQVKITPWSPTCSEAWK